jgi:hypothetical protein
MESQASVDMDDSIEKELDSLKQLREQPHQQRAQA